VSSEGQAVEWRRSGIAPADLSIFHVMECGTTVAPLATRRADLPVRLLWVGRLNANKDPLTVLRGVEPFLASHPGATLTMVYAENDLEREVRQRIDGSDVLRCRVTLLGRVERSAMPGHFSDADIFVLGSHREGSGYALIEALACGVMPVVSGIPSFRALTNDGREGELWRPGDAMAFTQALTRAVHRLTEDDRARRRAFFDRHFSWRAIGERAVRIYEEVVAGRRSSTRRR
jgi:glycosyltransferase involved in cell wall biosynthesis